MSDRSHSDLTVAVIHYQTPELLGRCLAGLEAAVPGARIVVVDTGESDPLPPGWQSSWPRFELLRHRNHSYAAAVNAVLRDCRTPRFAHLNADVLVRPNTFDELAQALDRSGAAMAGPLARDAAGRMQRNGLPYRWFQWRATAGTWVRAPWLSGCLQYLRTEAVGAVGGMDSSLRFYNEDLEWCLRLRTAGESCVLVNTEIVHVGGSSTPSSAVPIIEGLRGGYVLARRYRGPLGRSVHRFAVMAFCTMLGFVAGDDERRRAYRSAAAMLWSGSVDESPYGPTLASENPGFLAGGASS